MKQNNFSEPLVFEDITIETIKQDKTFQKSTKKQQKEYDTLKKKLAKEKLSVQKSQCAAIDKVIKGKKYNEQKSFYTIRTHHEHIYFQQERLGQRSGCKEVSHRADDPVDRSDAASQETGMGVPAKPA